MKKLIFGGLIFISGLIGILVLIVLSVLHPCTYNSWDGFVADGFKGFLMSYNLIIFFIIFSILSLVGIILCLIEVYKKK